MAVSNRTASYRTVNDRSKLIAIGEHNLSDLTPNPAFIFIVVNITIDKVRLMEIVLIALNK